MYEKKEYEQTTQQTDEEPPVLLQKLISYHRDSELWFLMAFVRMLTSAMSNTVKIAAKRKNVMMTLELCKLEIPALIGSIS